MWQPSDKDSDYFILEEGCQCTDGFKWAACSLSESTELKTGYSSPLSDLWLCGVCLLSIAIFTLCINCWVSCFFFFFLKKARQSKKLYKKLPLHNVTSLKFICVHVCNWSDWVEWKVQTCNDLHRNEVMTWSNALIFFFFCLLLLSSSEAENVLLHGSRQARPTQSISALAAAE